MKTLQGKNALITGASSGIGAALAREFARRGANIILLARNRGRMEAVSEQCQRLGAGETRLVEADTTDYTAIDEFARNLNKHIDYLVLNAGISQRSLAMETSEEVNRRVMDESYDLIISPGQVVPHEVIGMANYTKNIFVGVGGSEGINKSHFLGASYGMERIMGRAKTPVRDVLEYARVHFIPDLPIVYILTVRAKDDRSGELVTRGLFIGDDFECFERASQLSLETNFIMVDHEIRKCLVYLDPSEFKSTWLGNKAVYRTRMALADGADLIILAPALKEFGEDPTIDTLIRKYGYKGTPHTLEATEANKDLQDNLSASAHLIHGSSEGRFRITYCPGPGVSREEIDNVGFTYGDLGQIMKRYPADRMKDGWNIMPDGEEVYYISNPALGLWAYPSRFKD